MNRILGVVLPKMWRITKRPGALGISQAQQCSSHMAVSQMRLRVCNIDLAQHTSGGSTAVVMIRTLT